MDIQKREEIMQRIAKDYGKEFWYYSIEEQETLIGVYKDKEEVR